MLITADGIRQVLSAEARVIRFIYFSGNTPSDFSDEEIIKMTGECLDNPKQFNTDEDEEA